MGIDGISEILGDKADDLLGHTCTTIDKDRLHLPGPDFVERVMRDTDRSVPVLRNLQTMYNAGRLGGTGYLSILPVDQGIEHSAGASFAKNPDYFDPANIVELAIEGGCNAVASTLGVLGSVSRKYAHRIPMMLKLNHNEFLSYPNGYDQIMFASVNQAFEMGAVAVGADVLPVGVLLAEVQQQCILVGATRAVVDMATFAGEWLPAVTDRNHAGNAETRACRTDCAVASESNPVGLEFLELVWSELADAPRIGQQVVEQETVGVTDCRTHLILGNRPGEIDRIRLATDYRSGNPDRCDGDIA